MTKSKKVACSFCDRTLAAGENFFYGKEETTRLCLICLTKFNAAVAASFRAKDRKLFVAVSKKEST